MMPSRKSNPGPKPKLIRPFCEWSFEAIGTRWWIGLYEPVNDVLLQKVQRNVSALTYDFDRIYSRFRKDSLVTRVAQRAGTYHFPADAETLFGFYRRLYDSTDGAVTPLIGQLLADAGYDAQYSLEPGRLRTVPNWGDVMTYRDGMLITRRPVLLDFGAAGKGYLVDMIAKELQQAGVQKYCVDGSGDMVCRGLDVPLRIGLEHPDDARQVIGVAEITDGALCGSAGNRRTWANFTHIMNPKKLASPQHLKAVWAYAANALTADGLTTALYFTGAEKLHAQFQFEHCMLYTDGSISVSSGFPAELFSK